MYRLHTRTRSRFLALAQLLEVHRVDAGHVQELPESLFNELLVWSRYERRREAVKTLGKAGMVWLNVRGPAAEPADRNPTFQFWDTAEWKCSCATCQNASTALLNIQKLACMAVTGSVNLISGGAFAKKKKKNDWRAIFSRLGREALTLLCKIVSEYALNTHTALSLTICWTDIVQLGGTAS